MCFISPSKFLKTLIKKFYRKQLSNIIREKKEVIIVGDINFNYLDESNGKQFKELLSLNGFVQVVNGPTIITPNSETLIDVVLTSKPENVCDIKIIPTAISDHDAVECRKKINNTKDPYEIIRCHNYTNYNPEHLCKDLSTETFDSVYTSNNPNTAWQKTFDSNAPFITKKMKGKKTPWLTRELKHEINRRNILQRKLRKSKSITDLENFRRQRNRYNVLVRKAKNCHSKKILKKSANDPN